MNMRFQPTAELKDRHAHSSKDSNIAIHYNVQRSSGGTVFNMAVQNTARIFMKNLVINYDECCQAMHKGPGVYNHKNLGNLKNRSHKVMTLKVSDSKVKKIVLNYSFLPVQEDAFLKASGDSTRYFQAEPIKGSIVLFTE